MKEDYRLLINQPLINYLRLQDFNNLKYLV